MNKKHSRTALKEVKFPLLIIIVTALAVYSNTLGNGFVYDDSDQVLANPWLRDPGFLPKIFSSGVWDFKSLGSNYYRPIMHVIYMMTYYVFGLKPWGFHLVNLIFHAGSSVLVYLIARELLGENRNSEKPLSPSLIAGVLFAVHPIHTEAVAWVAAVTDLSYSFFCLLSFYLYMRSENRFDVNYYVSAAAFFLGALCKEPALMLPAIMVAYDLMLNKKKTGYLFNVKRYALFALAAVVYLGIRYHALGGFAPIKAANEYRSYGNLFIIVETYFTKLVLPVDLRLIYMFKPVESLFEARVLLALAISVLVIVLCYAAYRNDRLAFFCLLFIIFPLLPTLYVPAVGVPSLIGERYLYLPSAGFAILVSHIFTRLEGFNLRTVALCVLLALSVLYSAGTLVRNADWKDNYSLFKEEVRRTPSSGEAHNFLGIGYSEQGQYDLAIREFLTTIKLNLFVEDVYKNLGIAYGRVGMVDESIKALQQALEIRPNDPDIHNELGIEYSNKNDMKRAVEQFRSAVELDPARTMYKGNLEKALREAGEK